MYPVHAIAHIAARIGRFVAGHSPIPEGPLHHLNLGRQIALSLDPGPVMLAARRIALVTAMAMPVMSGGFAAGAAAGPIVVNYSPTITIAGATPADARKAVLEALREHEYEFGKMVDRVISNRQRSEF